MSKFKKIMAFLIAVCLLGVCFSGCGKKQSNGGDVAEQETPGEIDSSNIVSNGDTKMLISGNFRLDFEKTGGAYSVALYNAKGISSPNAEIADENLMYYQGLPATVMTRMKVSTTTKDVTVSAAYSAVEEKNYGYKCTAKVQTTEGSIYAVEDLYSLTKSGTFCLYRSVLVTKASGNDKGFASVFSMQSAAENTNYEDYEYFIPSIIYKDPDNMPSDAILSSLLSSKVYVKETRTGLPLAMLRAIDTGHTLTLSHYQPQITVNGLVGAGTVGAISSDVQYGGIGYTLGSDVSVDFIYPCAEGPTTYNEGSSWARRFHPVEKNSSHSYKLGLFAEVSDAYTDAMTNSFANSYKEQAPKIADDIPLGTVYEQNIDIFSSEYKEFTYNNNVVAAGVPWEINLATGKPGVYSFQMGFVGQQIPVGYQLYRYGLMTNNSAVKQKGKAILDFWASDKINGTYFPTVWWDGAASSSGGSARSYPVFLRCVVDGMEGMIDAVRIAEAYGQDKTKWYTVLKKTADNLVAKQNSDGSFYRAYRTDGNVETSTEDSRTQGMSKLNTPVAVRFLAKMYELTGEQKFKTAALAAADYSYENIYKGIGKYVGGTPDNANVVDKEAAVYAMYCFNAAYALSGNQKYLPAAEHAAISVLSWTYCYDFAVPSSNATVSLSNPFEEGGVIGFSLIAAGHSAADNFSSYAAFEMLRLYAETGNEIYNSAAQLLYYNTKSSTDYDGRMGWKYGALAPEASNISNFSFSTVGVWLPWSGIANIEALVNLYDAADTMDINSLNMTAAQIKNVFSAYGAGGKQIVR